MRKRSLLLLVIGSLCFPFVLPEISYAKHPADVIMEYYIMTPGDINPYTVSIMALNEVEHNRHLPEVKNFLTWYFDNLNYPDRHGLTGTIYDYVLRNGKRQPTGHYDSVDGYAGLFLHLLLQYVQKTGDVKLAKDNWHKVEDIVYLLSHLQDKDGLTRALADSHVKYLMDNCESYAGVTSYLALSRFVEKGDTEYYSQIQNTIRKGIFTHLYQSEDKIFAWAVEKGYQSSSNWDTFYPDAFAQLFPIYYGVLNDRQALMTHLWHTFNRKYAGQKHKFPLEQRIIYELTKVKMQSQLPDKLENTNY